MSRKHHNHNFKKSRYLIAYTKSRYLRDQYAKKVQLLKMNKSTGPDHIPPKLIKLAGTAIVSALVALFRLSIERGGCTGLKFS